MELIYYMILVVTAVMGNPCFNKILNMVPYPYNCNTFIVCWMSVPYYQACPVGSLFDITTNNCQPWPIAMCCNFVYPQLRRPLPPLPSSLPDGKLVRRILPPVQKTLPIKLLPDNVTTPLTKFPIQQLTTAQHLLTKLTTITEPESNNYKITTTSKEEALPTTKSFITLGTSPDTTSNIPVTSQTILSSESSLADKTISTTVFVSTSLPSTKEHLSETESTAKGHGIEPLPGIPIYSTIFSALTTPITGVTSTEQQISKQVGTEHITTKVTTSADTEIATELPTTPSDSTTIFIETITTSLAPKMTSPNLQPITITTLSHKSEEATVLPKSILTLFNMTVSMEINKKMTEKNISVNPTKSNSKVTKSVHESSSHLTDSGTKFSSDTTNIPPLTLSSSNPPLFTNSVGSRKPSEKFDINTSTSNGAIVTTGYTSVEYTTFKVKSITDINSIGTEPYYTAFSKLATIPAIESTLTPISNILARNGATIIESNTSKKSTTYKVTGVKEINSNNRDPNAASSTLATIPASESTLTPLIHTLATKGAPVKTSETPSEWTTSKVKSITEINSNDSGSKTASSTAATISARKSTLSSLISTLAINAATSITEDPSVETTTSQVKSVTDINTIHTIANTVTSTPDTISASKTTVTPLIPTLATNGASSITIDPSIELTTSKVKSVTDINTTRTEVNTVTSTPDTISASKTTVTPLIPTLATNGATPITVDQSVELTTTQVKSITDINTIRTIANTVTSTPDTITASETTVTPLFPTLATNGASSITIDPSIELTTSKVKSVTDINTTRTEANTATSTPSTISASKTTVTPLIPTLATNGATPITVDPSVESTTSKVNSITDINTTRTEVNTATSIPDTISESKTTLTPLIHTMATNGATSITSDPSVESTTYKETSLTDINSIGTELDTATVTLVTISASKTTLLPITPTTVTNGSPVKTSDTSLELATSKVKSITDINTIRTESNTATSTPDTITASKKKILPIMPSLATNEQTIKTSEMSLESTTNKVKSTTDIKIIRTEVNTAASTPSTISASKTTVTPLIPTLATNGATPIGVDPSVESTTSKVNSITDINTTRTEVNTATSTPDTISESKTTLTPLIHTMATNGATPITVDPSVESTTYKETSLTDINSTSSELDTATVTLVTISASKTTLQPIIPTTVTNGSPVKTSDTSLESTTSKVKSITDINTIRTESNTATSTPDTITASKTTLTPLIYTMATNGATPITVDPSVESTTYKETSLTDINSTSTELDTATVTLVTISSSKTTLLPIIPTTVTNGLPVKTSDTSLESTTSKVKSITDINTIRTESNTATSTPDTITASKKTLLPIMPSLATDGQTIKTSEMSLESTTNKVKSITDIKIIRTEVNIAASTPSTISASKTTVTPLIPTLATNGATPITVDPSVESTTSKVNSIIDINATRTEVNTATSTPDTISESKTTLTPLIHTMATNGATSITSDPSVELTTYKETSLTDNNSIGTELDTATVTLVTISASKTTLLPIIPTTVTNGSLVKTSDTSLEPTTSKVKSITDTYTTRTEPNTAASTLATISASKITVTPLIHTMATKGATPITVDPSVESTTSKVNSITDINTIRTESNTATRTPDTITASKKILLPIMPSLATNEQTVKTSEMSLESTTSKVKSITDTNTIRTEANTVTISPDTITASQTTILPVIHTLTTNGPTVKTSGTSLESTTPKVTSFTIINSNANTSPTAVTEEYTSSFSTKRPLTPTAISTKMPINESFRSPEPTTIASTGSKETTEISNTATERYPAVTDTPAKLLASTSTKILFSTKPSVSVANFSHTSKSDIVSTKRPWKPTTSFIITDSPQSTGITKQKKSTINSRRTLLPMPSTPIRPCPYYAALKTTEAPIEPQIPDCLINDNFVYPDLVNCHFYYKCLNGIIQRLNCRLKFGFHPHLMKCIPEESAKCGIYKSATDQKLYFTSFMLFNQIVKHSQSE